MTLKSRQKMKPEPNATTDTNDIYPKISEQDLVLLIPASLATGEPGDPLSAEVVALIMAMTSIGYGVVDFGCNNDNAIELWFCVANKPAEARAMASNFIRKGGYV